MGGTRLGFNRASPVQGLVETHTSPLTLYPTKSQITPSIPALPLASPLLKTFRATNKDREDERDRNKRALCCPLGLETGPMGTDAVQSLWSLLGLCFFKRGSSAFMWGGGAGVGVGVGRVYIGDW